MTQYRKLTLDYNDPLELADVVGGMMNNVRGHSVHKSDGNYFVFDKAIVEENPGSLLGLAGYQATVSYSDGSCDMEYDYEKLQWRFKMSDDFKDDLMKRLKFREAVKDIHAQDEYNIIDITNRLI